MTAMVTDPALGSRITFSEHTMHTLHAATPAICAALVVALGTAITHAMKVSDDMTPKPIEDLVEQPVVATAQAPVSDVRGRAPAV